MNNTYWIVGQIMLDNAQGPEDFQRAWGFQGVFDSEEKAVAACKTELYFIAPAIMNEELPESHEEWSGAYYPKLIPNDYQTP